MPSNIDNRVVEMTFDNKQFEKGVRTTLSSLERLKEGLDLDESTRSLQNLEKAGKSFSLEGLESGVQALSNKLSAMGIAGITAMQNMAMTAINTGKRIVSALTIDPIKSGFSEYETQINAVQTILANTESKGSTLTDVNKALDELNLYADKTIYNFTEMTRNIGTFTAAGVNLKTSVAAIKGIANLAAVSGSTSQQASTAMYQLSQALSAGSLKLQDWNSVVNAGMGGQVFQDALKETARVHKIAIDKMIKDEGSFRETLSEGWITSEILLETLSKFTGDLSKEQLKAMGYTDEQIKAIIKMGNTANDAATKVKTFTQLFDTLTEAAQSGWTQTWETIVGDFGEAKKLLTEISDVIGDLINSSSDKRNAAVFGGLASGWKQLLDKGIADEDAYKKTLSEVAKKHKVDIDKIIEKNGSLEDSFKDGWLTVNILKKSVNEYSNSLSKMTAKELTAAGYTEEQVKAAKDLSTSLKNGTLSAKEFINMMERSSGRENIISAMWNTFNALMAIITPVKEAFSEIFPSITADQIYKITEAIRDFTKSLIIGKEQAENINATARAVFSILHTIVAVVKGVIKVAAVLIKAIAPIGNIILSISAKISDYCIKAHDAIMSLNVISRVASSISDFINNSSEKIGTALEKVKSIILKIKGAFSGLNGNLTHLKESFLNFLSAFDPLIDKLKAFQAKIKNFFENVKSYIPKDITINISPFEKLSNILGTIFDKISYIFNKLAPIISKITTAFGTFISTASAKLSAFISNVDLSKIFSVINSGLFASLIIGIKDFVKSLKQVSENTGNIIENIGEFTSGLVDILSGVKETLEAYQNDLKAKTLLKIASAIAILSASLLVLSTIDSNKLGASLGAITGLFADLFASFVIFQKTIGTGNARGLNKSASAMITLSAGLLVLSFAMKKIAEIDSDKLFNGVLAIEALSLILTGTGKRLSKVSGNISKAAFSLILFGTAMYILTKSVEALGKLDIAALSKGLLGIGALCLELALFLRIAKFDRIKTSSSVGLIALATAMLILSKAIEVMGKLDWKKMGIGLITIAGSLLAMSLALKIMPKDTIKKSVGIIALSAAMLILSKAIEVMSKLDWKEMGIGLITLTGSLLAIAVALRIVPKDTLKKTVGIVILSSAILILSKAINTMSKLDWKEMGISLITLTGSLLAMSLALMLIPKDAIKKSAGIVILSSAILILSKAINTMSKLDWKEMGISLITLTGSLLAMSIALRIMPKDILKKSVSITIFASALLILSKAVMNMATMDWKGMGIGLITLTVALIDIVAALRLLPKDMASKSIGILVMALSIKKISEAITELSNLSIKQTGTSLLALTGSLLLLVATTKLLNNSLSGAAALLVLAVALRFLAPALEKFGNMSLGDIGKSLLMIAGIFTILGVSAAILKPLIPVMLALSGVVVLLGIGCAALGIGVMALASGLTLLAASGTAGAAALGLILTTIINLIPLLLVKIGEGIVAIIQVLTSSCDAIVEFVVVVVKSILDALIVLTPKIVEAVVIIVKSVLLGLKDLVPLIIDVALFLVISLLSSIRDNIGEIAYLAVEIVVEFINGISKSIPDVIQAGFDLIVSFITGLADAISGNTEKVVEAINKLFNSIINAAKTVLENSFAGIKEKGSELINKLKKGIEEKIEDIKTAGKNLIQGFIDGIESKVSDAVAKVKSLGSQVLDGLKNILGIASPSKEGYKIGMYADQGVINGLTKFSGAVTTASEGVAEDAVYALENSFGKISAIDLSDINFDPVIRPIMDISNINRGVNDIDNMFRQKSVTFSADVSSNMASRVAYRSNENINSNDISRNSDITNAINELRADVAYLSKTMSGLKVVMDSGELVGVLSPGVDRELGTIASRKGRGN